MLSLTVDDKKISVSGHYTPAALMEFERQLLTEQKKLTEPKDLDLSNLTGSDSGLIAVLLAFQRLVNKQGWRVRLINVNDGVKGLIKLSQLEDFFILCDSQ